MGGSRQGFGTRTMKIALGLLLLTTILAAGFAWRADPDNWTVADWTTVVISLLLGVYFFLLSQHINRNAQRRAEAMANAELITSTGVLGMNSARSLSGSDSSALRVAADARAALQHYPHASKDTQEVLVKSVKDAYIDLAFSTFSHSDDLARSVWTRLCQGTRAVVVDADALAFTPAGRAIDSHLASVADHVGFIELLGRALRENTGPDPAIQKRRPLSAVWDSRKLPYSRRRQGIRSEREETIYRLDRFEMLYEHELTVLHDWEILRRNAESVYCGVELVDIEATGDWLTPWYVGRRSDGQPRPVNVLGGELNERARHDKLQIDNSTPQWPNPLLHAKLPQGMRTMGIDNLCHVLETQPSPTICVLVYELCIDERSGTTRRLVLDGNHRLAAARRMSMEDSSCLGEPQSPGRFRVLTFLIRERQPVDDLATTGDQKSKPDHWKGFTPDIGLVRGTWRPDQSLD